MKKCLSLILTILLLLATLIVPVTANAQSTFTGDTYYKFTFGEDGTTYMNYTSGAKATHKNNSYYPLWDTSSGKTTISESSITDKATGETKDTMRIESKSGTSWQWTPLKSDGTPFEIAPNASYTVSMKFFVESLNAYGQLHFGMGASNTPLPASELDWQKGYFTTSGSYQGVLNDRQNVKFLFQSTSMLYAGNTAKTHDGFDSSNKAQYYDGSLKIVTDNNAVYDSANKSYSFIVDVWSSKQNPTTNAWENDKYIEDRVYNNYFTINGGGGTFTVDGETYNNVWEIVEIEVKLDPPQVKFINGNNVTTGNFIPGEEVKYPALNPNHKGDYVWSLSKDEYIPVPEKMTAGALTVYAYQRDIFGFENHKSYDYTSVSSHVKITDEFAYSGNKSIRYRNVEYGLSESQPFNWTTGYKDYHIYDKATDTYVAVTGTTAPEWKPDTYYMKRGYSALEHNIDLWKVESNKEYRITFRYYFTEKSACGIKIIPMVAASNFWDATNRVIADSQAVTINNVKGSWRVGEIYFKTGEVKSGYDNLFLRFLNTAGNDTTPCEAYFDEFRIEEKSKTDAVNPIDSNVYHSGFENYPEAEIAQNKNYFLMYDNGATTEDGKVYKNNTSIIDGASVFSGYTGGSVLKYDHLKGSYCSNHKSNLTYSYAQYNAVYPNTTIRVISGAYYKVTVSYKAEKVDTPVKLGWFMAAYSNQWTGGSVASTLGYTISAPTNDWVEASYIVRAPETFAQHNGSDRDLVHMWLYLEKDADVLIYFDDYMVEEIPSAAIVDEFGNTTYVAGEIETKITLPSVEGSREVYNANGTGNTVSGGDWYYDENCTKLVANANNLYFTNERVTYFYLKYGKAIEYLDDQQSYCGFENQSTVPTNGYYDATNRYVISRYDRGYTDENGIFHQGEWSLNNLSGFSTKNFKIANNGYMSEKSLLFKQTDNAVSNKIADIGNGVFLKDNTSYRLTFMYKAEGQSDKDLTFSFVNAKNINEFAEVTDENTVTIKADDVKNDWNLVSIDLTADFIDETYCIPAIIINANVNDTARSVYMDAFSVCKAVETKGVSVLKDDAAQIAGKQAMRFYFSYNADSNGKILFSGNTFDVLARGILIAAGNSDEALVRENSKIIKNEKTENLDNCWNYENGVLTFSVYTTDFGIKDDRTVKARGYVVLDDGSVHYSDILTFCIDDVVGYNNLEALRKDYSLNDSAVMEKARLMGANEKHSAGYTFDWNGSALVLNAKAVGDITVYLEAGTNLEIHKFTLYIDGKCITDQLEPELITKGKYKVTFNVGNYPTLKDIRFIRQREACEGGAAVITGFNMAGELYKSEEAELLIEYIGDSITSGIGVHRTPDEWDGDGTANGWAADGTNSYAFLSAMNMGVDWRIRSRSGIGAYINSGGGKGVNCDWYNSYILENSWRSTTTPYSEPRQADVVVIYLGTNDNWGFKTIDSEAETAELADGMKALIERVKSYNPDAKIVWVSGGMTDKYRESASRAINSFGGSQNGYFLCDVPLNMSAGQNGHPDAAQQRIIAKALEDFLKANVIK